MGASDLNPYEKKFLKALDKQLWVPKEEIAPSLQIQIFSKGRIKAGLYWGNKYPYFDLASLTKIMFTTSVLMQAFDAGLYKMNDSLSSYLSWFPHEGVSIKDILTHSGGMPWWAPYYKKISKKRTRDAKWKEIIKELSQVKRSRSKKALYSDIDFLLLGFFLEELYQVDLYDIWLSYKKQMGLNKTNFHLMNKPKYKESKYAPTEKCPWRKKILQGEVHDENTWALGGVAPQAGLFGPIGDLSNWGLELRKAVMGKPNSLCSEKTAKLFTGRRVEISRGDWGLGFMKASKNSSCGKFSKNSFGHLGFTGTSFWLDPKRDLMVCVFSNRVHPTRENIEIRKLRPLIHNIVVDLG